MIIEQIGIGFSLGFSMSPYTLQDGVGGERRLSRVASEEMSTAEMQASKCHTETATQHSCHLGQSVVICAWV